MADHRLPIDELNTLNEYVTRTVEQTGEVSATEAEDELEDLLILAYVGGCEYANEVLGTELKPDTEKMQKAIFKKFDGKDFRDRISEYAPEGKYGSIARVADTDTHRVYNQAILDTVEQSGRNVKKTWRTMGDIKVRDTHDYLEGITVDWDSDFVTYNGDHTKFPGEFGKPELDCNCRCVIDISV